MQEVDSTHHTAEDFEDDGDRADSLIEPFRISHGDASFVGAFEGHDHSVWVIVHSVDGRYVISGSWDGTIRIWDMRGSDATSTVLGVHNSYVLSLDLSSDGQTLVSGAWDGSVKVWDLSSRCERLSLSMHLSHVNAVRFFPDDRRVATASCDKTIKVWDVNTGVEIYTLRGHELSVNAFDMTSDGKLGVSASSDSTLVVWDLVLGTPLRTLVGHDAGFWINACVMLDDDQTVISGSHDKTIRAWNIESGVPMRILRGHTGPVTSLAVMGERILSGSDDGSIRVWKLQSSSPIRVIQGHESSVTSVLPCSDQRHILSASQDHSIRLWDMAARVDRSSTSLHRGPVTAMATSTNGRWLITGGADGSLACHQAADRTVVTMFAGHTGPVSAIVCVPGVDIVLSASWDGTVGMHVAGKSGVIDRVWVGKVRLIDMACSADGAEVLVMDEFGALSHWSCTADRRLVRGGDCVPVGRVAMALRRVRDFWRGIKAWWLCVPLCSRRLVSHGETGAWHFVDRSGQVGGWEAGVGLFETHLVDASRNVLATTLSSDGGRCVVLLDDGSVCLHDIGRSAMASGSDVRVLGSVQLSPVGKYRVFEFDSRVAVTVFDGRETRLFTSDSSRRFIRASLPFEATSLIAIADSRWVIGDSSGRLHMYVMNV